VLEGERTARYSVGYVTGQDEFLVRGCDVTGAGCSTPQPIRITIGAGPSFQGNAESLRPYREYISGEERQYLVRKLANNRFDLIEGDGALLGLQDLLRIKFLNADVTAPDLKPALQQVQSLGLKYGRPDPSEEFIPGWRDDFLPNTTCIASLNQAPQGPTCFQPIIPPNRNLNNPSDIKFAIERWKLTTERSWHQTNFFYHWGYHRTSSRYLKDARYLSPVAANMWKFWSGHFGTNTQIVNGFQENIVGYFIKTIDRELFGNFRSMMLGVPSVADKNGCAPLTPWNPQHGSILCDAASNMWLSNDKNLGMNQDFARELMELYLLSPTDEFSNSKNYNDMGDIISASRYVSGFQVTQAKPAMAPGGAVRFAASYNPSRHDSTPSNVFGELSSLNPSLTISNKTFTPGGFVRHLFDHHPALPRFIAGKLFATFVYPDPSDSLVAELGDRLRQLDYNLGAFLQVILGSEAMFSPRAALGRNCISSPLEVYSKILNSVRFPLLPYTNSPAAEEAFGIHIDANLAPSGENILGYPTVFGYDYCGRAPGVDGSTAWLFSHLMVFKINDFIKLLNGMTEVLKTQYDLSEAMGVIRANPEFADGSAQSVINYFAKRFDLTLSPAERSILLEFMNNRKQGNSLVAAPWNPNDTTPQGRLLIREKLAGLMTILAGFEQSSTH
jgi:hypothetical protein